MVSSPSASLDQASALPSGDQAGDASREPALRLRLVKRSAVVLSSLSSQI